jgi:hypothetical protein
MTITAKIMCLTLISAKKRSKKRKYIPKTAVRKAKNAVMTNKQQNNAPVG